MMNDYYEVGIKQNVFKESSQSLSTPYWPQMNGGWQNCGTKKNEVFEL